MQQVRTWCDAMCGRGWQAQRLSLATLAGTEAFAAALLSSIGIIHGYRMTGRAIINAYGPATTWPFVGYLVVGLLFWSPDGEGGCDWF